MVLVEGKVLALVKARDETPGPCIDRRSAGIRLADASEMNRSIVTLAFLLSRVSSLDGAAGQPVDDLARTEITLP